MNPQNARAVARWAFRMALAIMAGDIGWSLWLHRVNPAHDLLFGGCICLVLIAVGQIQWARGWEKRDRAPL